MKVILAKHAGFCYGVKRAVDIAENEAKNSGDSSCIYTLGPIIHNDEVINELRNKGVETVSLSELKDKPKSTVIIRSHGVGKEIIDRLKNMGHRIVDATCPFVKKIHNSVKDYSDRGYHIVILGDPKHAEVQGITGWIQGSYTVINHRYEAEAFSHDINAKICIVAQTTFNNNKFKEYVEIVNEKGYDITTLDTICLATYERQRETEEIATKVDAMIVIGDRNSSNSRKLFDIAKSKCTSFFVQAKEELNPDELHSIETVGITAGASTPDKIIREVTKECQK